MVNQVIINLPVGTVFKMQVIHCNAGCELYDKGLRDHMILNCLKASNSRLLANVAGKWVTIKTNTQHFEASFSYIG